MVLFIHSNGIEKTILITILHLSLKLYLFDLSYKTVTILDQHIYFLC